MWKTKKLTPEDRADELSERIVRAGANECWRWAGVINRDGYGVFNSVPRMLAHRAVWISEQGEIGPGQKLVNRCGNRACVNMRHWSLLDGHVAQAVVMELRGKTRLTREQVREAREAYAAGVAVHNAWIEACGEYKLSGMRRPDRPVVVTILDLARRYGVAFGTMHSLLKGDTYRHVQADSGEL